MELNRNISVTFGILLFSGIIFGILSSVPAIESQDYLSKLSSINYQVMTAAFFQFAMAAVYVFIAVLLFPIIKIYSERMALSYFAFRLSGAIFLFVGIVSLQLLLFVSREFVSADQIDASHLHTVGNIIRVGRDWLNHVAMILPWSIGGLFLYFSFFRLKVIPGWLSLWGFLGSVLTLAATLLLMFDLIKIVSPVYFILLTPMAVFESVLALYMVIKGFSPGIVNFTDPSA